MTVAAVPVTVTTVVRPGGGGGGGERAYGGKSGHGGEHTPGRTILLRCR